ncbi:MULTISPECIES: DUF1206 domain-containing protein [Sphingobium]|uniref:DUF1206 domain-containing protein n=1 Tax=Sphingobium TaxID=165695 RepID=UPI0015EC006C|nr:MULTISPECIES: DUF1206 domain-containing protein [Sphingobium]MCW2363232.1 hypothetical protein [Sphingobium sp. B10D3B]MCW2403369.1 hypothetical protein [Sphingobium sp. B10D7B]MCW2407066.1 hypothetical protein [Sphingobium xanthum]
MDTGARLTMLARAGFATRGALYIVIAFLVLRAGRAEDPSGALEYVGDGGGMILLGLMAAGLIGYGLWRLSDAAFNIERHDDDTKGKISRVGAAASGLIHLFLAWQAIRLMQGTSGGSGGGTEEGAQSALQLPGGFILLIIGGLILIGTGLYQLFKAAKGSYLKHLESQVARKAWAQWTGRLGYAARGIIFLITGGFLVSAGLDSQASEAGGMSDALAWLTNPWDILIAIGLLGFGMFSLIEARYRRLQTVSAGPLASGASRFGW